MKHKKINIPNIEVPLAKNECRLEIGKAWKNPKEIWGFLRQGSADAKPVDVAKKFIRINSQLLGLESTMFSNPNNGNPRLEYIKTINGLGAHHVLFRQMIGPVPLRRGHVTVHMDNQNTIYMCKCRAMPKHILATWKSRLTKPKCTKTTAKNLVKTWILENKKKRSKKQEKAMQVPCGPPYPVEWKNFKYREAKLYYKYLGTEAYLCWCIRVSRIKPKEEWAIYVWADTTEGSFSSAQNDAISHIRKTSHTAGKYATKGWGFVFDPNPVTALAGHEQLIKYDLFEPKTTSSRDLQARLRSPPEVAYRLVDIEGLDRSGYLCGKYVRIRTPRGKPRMKRTDGDFRVWTRVPGSEHPTGFEEVMTYYHISNVLRRLQELGYRDEYAIFKRPLVANVYYSDEDNAWYNNETGELYFGTGEISEAEDGETIVHETGHAILDRICPNFGQNPESLAIGEGFSDYLAMTSFYTKKPENYRKTVMSWDGLARGLAWEMEPPSIRSIDESKGKLNYDKFKKEAPEHDNGRIWSSTLLAIYESIGRERADKIIIESHFELSAHATFARAARAIIHANRNLYDGKYEWRLLRIFKKKRIDCGFFRKPKTHGSPELPTPK